MDNITNKIQLLIIISIATLFCSPLAYSDIEIGGSQAPVTIIEYGSITCGKCVRFHRNVLPLIKSHYIEPGIVRFIYRDFPTSTEATRGAIAAHCAGPDQYYMMLDALYESVGDWSQAKDVDTALIEVAISKGLNREAFISCLNDPQQLKGVEKEKEEAILEYDVFGTPTFIINGEVIRGLKTFSEMEVLLENANSE